MPAVRAHGQTNRYQLPFSSVGFGAVVACSGTKEGRKEAR